MTPRVAPAIDGRGHATLSVASILSESATRHPDRPAVHFAGVTTTYRELWQQTRAYAGALRARGIGPGSRVAMLVPNVPDFARVYYASLALGAVVVPIHLLFKADEIAYVLEDSQADLLVAAAPLLAEALPAAAAVSADGRDGAGFPSIRITPRRRTRAQMALNTVVLPAPLGPMSATISPG